MFGQKSIKHKISFNILICVGKDGDKFHAFVPALKGIQVDGDTQYEALENAKTACVLYIKSLIKHGEPIPLQHVQQTETCYDEHSDIYGSSSKACLIPQTETIYVPA